MNTTSFNLNKKLVVVAIIAVLVGVALGSLVNLSNAKANVLEDIWNFVSGKNKGVENSNQQIIEGTSGSEEKAKPYEALYDYERAIINVAKKASPAVVSVVITKDLPVIEQCPQVFDPFFDMPYEFKRFFGDDFGFQFYAPCQRGTTTQEIGGGSGFIVSEDGLIITNKHVVSDTSADYTVLLNDGKKYKAKILARDPIQDIAILKIDAKGLPVLKLGNSDTLELGQTVIAIGNALGEFRNTVSVGVISGLSRTITASGAGYGTETIRGVIQTDAAINPGNSGGPLLNLKGEVIGINTAIVSGAQNIGFAIPVNNIKRDIKSVKETGSIKTPYLGVRYITVTEELAKKQKLPVSYGALLRGDASGPAVQPNSPAAKSGLLAEDIILEVNGVRVEEKNPLLSLIGKYNVGDEVNLKVLRGGKTIEVKVKLEERPANL